MRVLICVAAALLSVAPALARSPVGLGSAFPMACASGYHPDAGGNFQPDAAQANRYCPTGTVFHPTFDSWTCDPPPPEAY